MTITSKGIEHGWARGADWLAGGDKNWRLLDAYALDQWATNVDATAGLTYGHRGGIARTAGGLWSVVAAGTVALADGATNYIERTTAGVVSANVVGFTAASLPMAVVVTAGGEITGITDRRVLAALGGAGSALEIQDEGSSQGPATTLNVTGSGASVVVAGGVATLNVPGGSGAFTIQTRGEAGGGTWTPASGDVGKWTRFTNTVTPVTVTIDAGVVPAGQSLVIEQAGSVQITLAAGAGVTINVAPTFDLKTREQFAVIQLVSVATDVFTLFGHLADSP